MSFENQSPAQQRYRRSSHGQAVARAARRKWRLNHPDREKAHKLASYKKHRTARLRYSFERRYGITWEDRDRLLAEQGGVCKLCGSTDHGAKSRGWHTDHDASKQKGEPGFIRGILCLSCNTGLGHFDHDPTLFENAKRYCGGGVSHSSHKN